MGRELAVKLLPYMNLEVIAAAEPTWLAEGEPPLADPWERLKASCCTEAVRHSALRGQVLDLDQVGAEVRHA